MVGATIPSQVAAMQVVALGGFSGVSALRPDLSIENIPVGLRWISNFMWAGTTSKSCGMRYSKWRLARRLVEGRDHRPHRLGFLRGWMVQHAPNAAQSVSVVK